MRILPTVLSVCLLWFSQIPAPGNESPARAFLHDTMGFSASDLREFDAGRAVARQMHIKDAIDVNIFGAVRIAAPAEELIRRVREIDVLERRLGVLQVGKFRNPPQLADLAGLTLDRLELDDLKDCRPHDCELQLPGSVITALRTNVNWRGPEAAGQAQDRFRATVFDWLERYRRGGFAALPPYDDRARSVSVAPEFGQLLQPHDLPKELPELTRYLLGFPSVPLPGADDFYYWNKSDFGMKPTVRLNHVTIYPLEASALGGIRYVVATSQIYSNHYFSATLELRSVMDDPARSGRGVYLFYTTRSRIWGLTGFRGTLMRSSVRSRARAGMERYLTLTKSMVEQR